jgi:hypothetical protein
VLGTLAWLGRRGWPWPGRAPLAAGRIPELVPLLRTAGRREPPFTGETAGAWLARLAALRPDRAAAMAALGREADAAAYGGKGRTALGRLAREEAKHWRKKS